MCIIGHQYEPNRSLTVLYAADGVSLGLSGLPVKEGNQYTLPFIFKDGKQVKLLGTATNSETIIFLDISTSTQDLIAYSDRMIIPDVGEYDLTGAIRAMTAGMNCFSENY